MGFEFRLRVTLGIKGDLMTTSRIKYINTDDKPFNFTFAYHNYFHVSDIRDIYSEVPKFSYVESTKLFNELTRKYQTFQRIDKKCNLLENFVTQECGGHETANISHGKSDMESQTCESNPEKSEMEIANINNTDGEEGASRKNQRRILVGGRRSKVLVKKKSIAAVWSEKKKKKKILTHKVTSVYVIACFVLLYVIDNTSPYNVVIEYGVKFCFTNRVAKNTVNPSRDVMMGEVVETGRLEIPQA
ncbi:hypothetical protein LXL04_011096 [Taraxacum kok-saghyz]